MQSSTTVQTKSLPTPQTCLSVSSTPLTNRGVENTLSFGVHWFTGTTHLPENEVLDMVSTALSGASFEVLDRPLNMYGKRLVTLAGITVLIEPLEPENMPPVCLVVPGSGCELLGLSALQKLASVFKPTRVDLAFDGAPFSPREARDLFLSGFARTRAKRTSWDFRENHEGTTLKIGSRQSSQYLCCYDRRGLTRLELRLSGERAEKAYDLLQSDPDTLRNGAIGLLRGFIDFVEPSKNRSRAPLMAFWQQFTEGLTRVTVNLEGTASFTVEKVKRFIEHQVSATLSTYAHMGFSISHLLEMGKKRLKPRHKALIALSGTT